MMSDHYTYRVSWSEEDGEHVGTCAEFPSLSHLADTRVEALQGIEQLVNSVVQDMRNNGEPVPVAIAERPFSGNFQTRVPADLHRRLTLEAAEAGVSLNRLVNYKLTTQVVTVRMVAQPRRPRIRETA